MQHFPQSQTVFTALQRPPTVLGCRATPINETERPISGAVGMLNTSAENDYHSFCYLLMLHIHSSDFSRLEPNKSRSFNDQKAMAQTICMQVIGFVVLHLLTYPIFLVSNSIQESKNASWYLRAFSDLGR